MICFMSELHLPKRALARCHVYFSLIFLCILFFSELTVAQKASTASKVITGQVVNDAGKPLPGVTVQQKGADRSTVTDTNGAFSLTVTDAANALIFSHVGMEPREVSITGKSNIVIDLKSVDKALGEVVVVGYGTQKKANLIGSVAAINGDQLVSVPVASAVQAFSGRLPGLITKQTSGKPGTPVTMSIRGFGNALIIVDGVEQTNYENIDPSEIESVSILKDASSAVYGARAGNGVVLITTRRGKLGDPKLSFSSASSWQRPTIYPKFTSSADWATVQNEAAAFANLSLPFTDQQIQKYRDGTDPDYLNTDHYSNIIKPWTLMQTNNLNLSGGSKNVSYFLSAGLMYQDGIYKSNGVNLNRYNLRSNVDIRMAKGLTVGLDASCRYTVNNDVPSSSSLIFGAIGTTPNKFPAHYPDPAKKPFVGRNAISPYILIDPDLSGTNVTNLNYLTGALSLAYEVPSVKGLVARVKGNYTGSNQFNKIWTIPYSTYNYDKVNDIYTVAATGSKYSLTQREDIAKELTLQSSLDYEHSFGEHNIKALLLNEMIDTKTNWFSAYNDGYISGAVSQFFAGSTNPIVNGSAFQERRTSFVGRINYSYLSKYFIESTVRYDGSSRFASARRFSWFPSVLLGWRISEEKFMKDNVSAIDNLKLRLSASHTGYDRNAVAYQYLSTYAFNSQYIFGGTPYRTLTTNGIANPDISWENIYTYNAGMDISAWHGLISAELDVFYRLRDGVLGTKAGVLPSTFGATLPQQNINSIDNRGFELVLKHHNRIKDFEYNISANFSFARSKYVHFDEQPFTDPDLAYQQKKTGQWVDRTLGYITNGFFNSQDDINSTGINYDLATTPNSTIKPGMVKFVDVNGDGKIDFRDQREIGRGTIPQTMYGINLDFRYKGFDFGMLWQGAGCYRIAFNNNMSTISINNVWNSYQFLFDGRWTPTNTANAKFPVTTYGANAYDNQSSDLWLRPGDYMRLKEISLGYTIPKKIISKIKLSSARIYAAGYNVLLLDRLGAIPYDPEGVGSSWEYPLYKSFSVGLNLSL